MQVTVKFKKSMFVLPTLYLVMGFVLMIIVMAEIIRYGYDSSLDEGIGGCLVFFLYGSIQLVKAIKFMKKVI